LSFSSGGGQRLVLTKYNHYDTIKEGFLGLFGSKTEHSQLKKGKVS